MTGIFTQPKQPKPVPVPDPYSTANRINMDLVRRLQGQGSNSTLLSSAMTPGSATGASKAPSLTGLSG